MFGPLVKVVASACNALIKYAAVAEITADMCINIARVGEYKSSVMLEEEKLNSEAKLDEIRQSILTKRAAAALTVNP